MEQGEKKRNYLHPLSSWSHSTFCSQQSRKNFIVSSQEVLVLSSFKGMVDIIPVLNLLRQRPCVYFYMTADKLSPRYFKEVQNIHHFLEENKVDVLAKLVGEKNLDVCKLKAEK